MLNKCVKKKPKTTIHFIYKIVGCNGSVYNWHTNICLTKITMKCIYLIGYAYFNIIDVFMINLVILMHREQEDNIIAFS